MRIGILTQPLRYNYGGILQNYALQTVLKRMGHSVVTLDGEVKCNTSFKKKFFRILKLIFNFFVDKNGKFLYVWKHQSTIDILSKNTRIFIDRYISVQKLKHLSEKDFDVLVVGSDQVWRPSYSNLDEAYLHFARKWKHVKRIAYAASFGSDEWEYTNEETQFCKQLIKLFDAVSVREKSGIGLCKNHFEKEVSHVLDPTMLLTKEDYINNLCIKNVEISEGNLFYYFLDGTSCKKKLVNNIARHTGLKSFTVNSLVENISAPLVQRIQPPIEKWLRAFYDARFIVTDSFHGCVFSIIFNKPFVVVGNGKRGMARFESLLGEFNQQFRMLQDGDLDIDMETLAKEPDVIIGELYKGSYNFITNNLN